jgi:hypothetical protein
MYWKYKLIRSWKTNLKIIVSMNLNIFKFMNSSG